MLINLCEFSCRFTHDNNAYLAAKLRDVRFPLASALKGSQPFVVSEESLQNLAAGEDSSVDFGTSCLTLEKVGETQMQISWRSQCAKGRERYY